MEQNNKWARQVHLQPLWKRFSNFRCVLFSFQHLSVISSSWASSWSKRAVGRQILADSSFWKALFWGTSLLTGPSFRAYSKISLSLNNPQNPKIQLFQGSSRQKISCLLYIFDYNRKQETWLYLMPGSFTHRRARRTKWPTSPCWIRQQTAQLVSFKTTCNDHQLQGDNEVQSIDWRPFLGPNFNFKF